MCNTPKFIGTACTENIIVHYSSILYEKKRTIMRQTTIDLTRVDTNTVDMLSHVEPAVKVN